MSTQTELDEPIEEPIDGRTARAVRTKDAIVEATLGLIDEGDLRPTGPRIAERAGVSVRSIFQHFDDLDALFSAVGAKVAVRIAGLLHPIDPALALDERVTVFVKQRTEVMEALTPVLRAALVHAASSTVIRNQFEVGHGFLGAQVDAVFATELDAAEEPMLLREALMVSLSWVAWDLLRGAEGKSEDDASAVIDWSTRAALRAAGFAA
ncbi:TetR/AcrR family transcriptional regulator [Aquihabitans sp. McL0605]|uniref:TetR/AcrR family transcriptional regulator n=1 Tax=Aquihabitans sp. McL0605 TaxID=3415671 RepID=UPI003CEAB70B